MNPSRSKWRREKTGYDILAQNLESFNDLGFMPLGIDITRLNDGSGISNTLMSQNASWHKSCWSKFDQQKLERARKRKPEDLESSPVKTR